MLRGSLFGINCLSLGNIINLYGVGANLDVLQGQINYWVNPVFLIILNLMAICSFVILLMFTLFIKLPDKTKLLNISFVYWLILLYIILFLIIAIFDRYLLMVLPLLLIYISQALRDYGYSKFIFLTVLLIMMAYGGIGTYDYLSWQRTRWTMGKELIAQGVARQDIEGGYEWNGWYLYNHPELEKDFNPELGVYLKAGSPGFKKPYVISFSALPGYQVIEKHEAGTIFSKINYIYLNRLPAASTVQ